MTENLISTSIAQKIVLDYFGSIMNNRENIQAFYHKEAVLEWEGNNFKGQNDIKEYLNNMPPKLTFRIAGFDAHPVVNTELLVMLMVFGTYQVSGFNLRDFHCTFYIGFRENEGKAYIHYQVFTTF